MSAGMPELYPLRFTEILRNYSFGNRWIVDVFDKEGLPSDHRIAETWEVCDRPGESSTVNNGSLCGTTLHELIAMYGERLLGTDVIQRCGTRFPLLIKFLDASNPLGEQVHQNDTLAAKQGLDDPGKTEAWYMIKVREGATIHCGNRSGVTEAQILEALAEGTIRECMQEYAVHPGDAFQLYAGTMHYSGGGVLFYEIMQNSDVIIGLRPRDPTLTATTRAQWARTAMEGIHLEEGYECKTRPICLQEGANQRTYVLACSYYALERLHVVAPYVIENDGSRFYVLSQIDGTSTIVHQGRREIMRSGNSVLLPANLRHVSVEPQGDAVLLKAYVPDLWRDIIEPLRQAGVPDLDILALGGRTELNPLRALV